MRSGRHRAKFTILDAPLSTLFFGVIRPDWDVETSTNSEDASDHRFYFALNGSCHPGNKGWKNYQSAKPGDAITIELNLNVGTMTVWKNEARLGVMAKGLSGKYCWAINTYNIGDSARIELVAC